MKQVAQLLADFGQLWRVDGNLALFRDAEIFTVDTRLLTKEGGAVARATLVPEATLVGTTTPTPRPPIATVTATPNGADSSSSSNEQDLPSWFPFVVGGGITLIIIVLGLAYWQSRRRKYFDM